MKTPDRAVQLPDTPTSVVCAMSAPTPEYASPTSATAATSQSVVQTQNGARHSAQPDAHEDHRRANAQQYPNRVPSDIWVEKEQHTRIACRAHGNAARRLHESSVERAGGGNALAATEEQRRLGAVDRCPSRREKAKRPDDKAKVQHTRAGSRMIERGLFSSLPGRRQKACLRHSLNQQPNHRDPHWNQRRRR